MKKRPFSTQRPRAKIVLEDGTTLSGFSFGAAGSACGEVVFNTSLTGYQEILTDPSYKGQIVTMTYPLIGNYGVNKEDEESCRPFLEGFVVKECSRMVSNWRADMSLPDYLQKHNILGIEGVDTRALTRRIRLQGAMRAIISTEGFNDKKLLAMVKASPSLVGRDLVKEVTCKKQYDWNAAGRYQVVVIDCGVKFNILRSLAAVDCRVSVVPAGTSAENILVLKPDGVMLSNGPGDPAAVTNVIATVKALIGKVPIFGICLGQQMIGHALGGRTYKLKFGHHGGNQPIKELKTGKIAISVQNHGFCVDLDSLSPDDIEMTHVNLNDNTLEGIRHKKYPLFAVQYHPEACPGPHDAQYLFGEFVEMMEKYKGGQKTEFGSQKKNPASDR